MEIFYSPRFVKNFRKLPTRIRLLVSEKEKLFLKDMSDPRLKTHKLTGKLSESYSFSINYQYRIIFLLIGDEVIFADIGTHKIYK